MSDYMYCGRELYHYGVKGMKWGVRRTKTSVKNNTNRVKNVTLKDVSPETIRRGKTAVEAMKTDIQLFSHKKDNKGRAHRMPKAVSEAVTNASHEQRNSPSYTMNIGKYKYMVINRPGDSPIVKPLYRITKTIHDKRKG